MKMEVNIVKQAKKELKKTKTKQKKPTNQVSYGFSRCEI